MIWAGHVARMTDEKYIRNYNLKNWRKQPFWRPKCRWED